jgi:hypothetical protein
MEFLGVFLLVFLLVRSPKHLQARIVPTVDLPFNSLPGGVASADMGTDAKD